MSETPAPVDLVLLWHQHQPDYRDPRTGSARLPWARLHASKDYLDMARRLERWPSVKATFNLVPSLLDQIEAVAAGEPDELFTQLARPIAELSSEERRGLMWRCAQMAGRAIERWPACRALRDRAIAARREPAGMLGDRDLLRLEIWFLVAWVDPMFHDQPEAARALGDYPRWSERHRDDLIALHLRLAVQVIPAHRALAERGQVELSTSPYHHPILPLLIDLATARRARPDLALPGEPLAVPEDARWHVERALVRHAERFGARPAGLWPSEGSVSPEVAALAARAGVRWLASDEAVLWASLTGSERRPGAHYRPWRIATEGGEVALFFRDHELSDRIGFVYQSWDPAQAAADFVARLRRIGRDHAGERAPVVSVILDGENCWEHYPEDGNPFLEALYAALDRARDIRTRTPSEVIADGAPTSRLTRLHSGSWIDADFHIWIGHAEKNRAWELLARTRRALIEAGATPERAPAAWQALYRAQGSDWFWWFGDDHHTDDRPVFDRLFRDLLGTAYEHAGLAAPPALRLPVTRPRRDAASATMPIQFISPTLDGRRTTFYEWEGGGRIVVGPGTAMHRTPGLVRELHFGFDAERFYLRLDFRAGAPPGADVDLRLEFVEPRPVGLRVRGLVAGERAVEREEDGADPSPVAGAACRIDTLFELGIPFASLGLAPGDAVALLAQALRDGRPFESYPGEEGLRFSVPDATFESDVWSV